MVRVILKDKKVQDPLDIERTLESILKHMESQYSDFKNGVICACLLVFISTHATELCRNLKLKLSFFLEDQKAGCDSS